MPRSRRNREVALSKVRKEPSKEKKDSLIEKLHDAVEKYAHGYALRVENERNQFIKDVRKHFSGTGTLFMGKNNVMKLALGNAVENEVADKIHQLSDEISGSCALLFTDQEPAAVQQYFMELNMETFARSGAVATETVVIPQGEMKFPHSIEAHLRSIGLPTSLKEGKVLCLSNHTVCTAGQAMTTDQAQVLKLLGKRMSEFRMTPTCIWTKADGGSFKLLSGSA